VHRQLATVQAERKNDPDPGYRDPYRLGWAQREELRKLRERRALATLTDYCA